MLILRWTEPAESTESKELSWKEALTVAWENFTGVRGGGNWSDVSNWYRDSDGKTPATRYPGGVTNTVDGVDYRATDDVVLFASTATGTITLHEIRERAARFPYEKNISATRPRLSSFLFLLLFSFPPLPGTPHGGKKTAHAG